MRSRIRPEKHPIEPRADIRAQKLGRPNVQIVQIVRFEVKIALELANNAAENAKPLERERLEIEARLKAIEATIQSANLYRERSRNFRAEVGGNLQCPRCWVLNEAEVSMVPVRSDTQDDLFRCSRCKRTVEIRIGG